MDINETWGLSGKLIVGNLGIFDPVGYFFLLLNYFNILLGLIYVLSMSNFVNLQVFPRGNNHGRCVTKQKQNIVCGKNTNWRHHYSEEKKNFYMIINFLYNFLFRCKKL